MTTLQPEQIQALEYLRRKGTEASAAQLHGHMEKTFRDLEALLETVPEDLRAARPAPDAWSVHEIVDHLVESHRPAVEQLRSLVAGLRPMTDPIPANLQSPDALERPWDGLVSGLREIHRALLSLVEEASDDPGFDATAPVIMVAKIQGGTVPLEWVHELDWKAYAQAFRSHTAQHRAQIARNLEALGRS